MAGSISNDQVVNLFKQVYGDLQDLLPEDYRLAKDIPFNSKQKVGEKYVEAVVLSHETGWTLAGSSMDAIELNPAIAGAVKQTEVTPYISVLGSIVPWGVISRSAGAGDKAFFEATKHIVRNNLKSHSKLLEIMRLYGQSAALLGYVSYATATYREVAFTNGTATLNGVAFTNGINAAGKNVLLAPGSFASGIWVGMEGAIVQEVDASNVVLKEGQLVGVEADFGYITVDFTPTAASSTTSHRLCFKGMAESNEMIGMNKILNRATSSLFGISTSLYSIWHSNHITLAAEKLKLKNVQDGVAGAANRGGLDTDINIYVNPRSWATITTTESGARSYDKSYNSSEADNGFEDIVYYAQNGKCTIIAHRMVKEGEAYGVCLQEWSRSGSAEVAFQVPGINKEIIFPLENQTAYAFRSYADQYLFCYAPAKSILWDGINDESAS
jgi:hypothetical protein